MLFLKIKIKPTFFEINEGGLYVLQKIDRSALGRSIWGVSSIWNKDEVPIPFKAIFDHLSLLRSIL